MHNINNLGYYNKFKKSDYSKDIRLKFFSKCPHFLSCECKSFNWNSKSPCNKCFEQGIYDKNNAELIKCEVSLQR